LIELVAAWAAVDQPYNHRQNLLGQALPHRSI